MVRSIQYVLIHLSLEEYAMRVVHEIMVVIVLYLADIW
jgi:hypothetical protein